MMEKNVSASRHAAHLVTLLRLVQPLDGDVLGPYIAQQESVLTTTRQSGLSPEASMVDSLERVTAEYVRQMSAAIVEHESQARELCRILGLAPLPPEAIAPGNGGVPDLAAHWRRITRAVESVCLRAAGAAEQHRTIEALRARLAALETEKTPTTLQLTTAAAAATTDASGDGVISADPSDARVLRLELQRLTQRVVALETTIGNK